MHQINYKITVQYEGTRYKGWQKQPGTENTIQGKLETLLSRCLDTPIEVWGAGRTDAGVHALGQTANFWVPEDKLEAFAAQEETSLRSMKTSAEDATLFSALNHYLPEDIAVPQMVRASERFHARYLASSKWYRYRIRTSPVSDVMNRRFLWQYGSPLDIEKMHRASRALIGTHDFTSYCGLKMKKSAVRTITDIRITQPDQATIFLDYYGDGFLNHMVRLLTGELVEVGAGRFPEDAPAAALEAQTKGAACHTAPASGLTLMKVVY